MELSIGNNLVHITTILTELVTAYENLRAWVRTAGEKPPRFETHNSWLEDVSKNPVTEYQADISRIVS